MPKLGFICTDPPNRFSASVEPVRNILNTLLLIADCNEYPGIHPFILETHADLDEETRKLNETLTIGLCYSSVPDIHVQSFQMYLKDLEQTEPYRFVERLFHAYDHISACKVGIIADKDGITVASKDIERLLSSKQVYLKYLEKCFGDEPLDYEIEGRAYDLLKEPQRLKETMIRHFEVMWNRYLKKEFAKNMDTLLTVVDEYNRLAISSDLEPFAIVKKVTGHDIEKEWAAKPWELEWIAKSRQIVFVPSFHMGPYLGRKLSKDVVYLFFSPRIVDGLELSSTDLTRADISSRLTTLGDDVRLQILKMLTRQPELSSKQIMDELNLTQSSASRHLKQLSVTGFINERRDHSAKIYSLNRSFVTQTLDAASNYLKLQF